MKKEFLECGKILRIHGINGGLVVNHLCDSYEVFSDLKTVYFKENEDYVPRKIKKVSFYKNNALVILEGVSDADSAIKLRNRIIYASRNDLVKDSDSFFIADLIGLDVYDNKTGTKYGVLSDVINSGAQDIYVVTDDDGKNSFIPVVKEFVKDISLEKGIAIEPIEGMIE